MTTTEPSPSPTVNRWGIVALAATFIVAAAIALAAVALTRDSSSTTPFSSNGINATTQVGRACQQYLGTPKAAGVDGAWCGHMNDWMYQQMQSGRAGSMMWGNPTAMYNTCVAAMGSYQPQVGDPAGWCSSMVDWMNQRGYGWMMRR